MHKYIVIYRRRLYGNKDMHISQRNYYTYSLKIELKYLYYVSPSIYLSIKY